MELPEKPQPMDCCNSGCNPCILDAYETRVKTKPPSENCLSPTKYSKCNLIKVSQNTTNCSIYTFECDDTTKGTSIQYEPGQYLYLKAISEDDTQFQRAYTPIFIKDPSEHQFIVLVKLIDDGKMSEIFRTMPVGASTLWRGPYGDFTVNYSYKNVLFIAQGVGLAPIYTIICNMLNYDNCFTRITLFFCCNSSDVILHDCLYELSHYWNFRYELYATKGTIKEKYKEVVKYCRITKNDIETYLNNVNKELDKLMICGGEIFMDDIKHTSISIGIDQEDIILF